MYTMMQHVTFSQIAEVRHILRPIGR